MSEINVHIGEVRIAHDGEILKAILGSCVGIGMIWRAKKICGLAHCLLPESPTQTFEIGGRYVNQAIPSLLALMKVKPEDFTQLEVVLTGGGNMTSPGAEDVSQLIGTHNFRCAEREIARLGLRLVHSDGGGQEGRRVFVDSSNCSYRVEKIPRS